MRTAAAIASDRAAQPVAARAWARVSATLTAVAALGLLVAACLAQAATPLLTFRDHRRTAGHGLAGRVVRPGRMQLVLVCLRRCVLRGATLRRQLRRAADRGRGVTLPAMRRDGVHPDQSATHGGSGALRADLPGRHGGPVIPFIAKVARRKAPVSRVETPRFEAPPEHRRLDCLPALEQSCERAPSLPSPAERSLPQAGPCPAAGETFRQAETAPPLRWRVSPAREVAAAATS